MEDWRNLTVAQLHERYEQANYAANTAEVMADLAARSAQTQDRLPFEHFVYGPEANEDGYWARPAAAARDVVCFIHGGAWRGGRAEGYLDPAEWVCGQGAHYVALNFSPVLDFQGRLFPMVEQLVRGLAWVIRRAGTLAAAPRIHLLGHSSGAHLAACVAMLDWSQIVPEHPEALMQAQLCSGMYDLEPVSYSARRSYLRLEAVERHALSPIGHHFSTRVPITIAYGEHESPEFLRQSRSMAEKLRNQGVPVKEAMGAGLNHFEVAATLGSPKEFWGELLASSLNAKAIGDVR